MGERLGLQTRDLHEFSWPILTHPSPALPRPPSLQAWLRSRGTTGVKVYTSEDVVDQFGVVKGSYDSVPLPPIKAHTVGAPSGCGGVGGAR